MRKRVFGVMVNANLSLYENCTRRASKLMNDLSQMTPSLLQNGLIYTNLNAFTGEVVPIITNASQTRVLNKANFEQLETVQKLATRWILK